MLQLPFFFIFKHRFLTTLCKGETICVSNRRIPPEPGERSDSIGYVDGLNGHGWVTVSIRFPMATRAEGVDDEEKGRTSPKQARRELKRGGGDSGEVREEPDRRRKSYQEGERRCPSLSVFGWIITRLGRL